MPANTGGFVLRLRVLSRARAALIATALGVFGLGMSGSGCRPHAVDAPYAKGEAPTPELLLAATAPQLPAIQVSQAKVIANRALRGNLAFLAQSPARFRGTVGVAGNELATLSFTEQGYALRYKLDAYPTGFYHGPPSSCAVEALLGVAIDETDLVALVLGGGPVIEGPHEVLEQQWDRAAGHERLTIANARFVQQLDFRPIDGQWRFVGGSLWQRNAEGGKGDKQWSLSHDGLARHGEVVLPERTQIVAPGKRKDNLVTIVYKARELDPAFAKTEQSSGADEGGNADGPSSDDGAEGAGDWGGNDGWEDEQPTEQTPPEPASPSAMPKTGLAAPASPTTASPRGANAPTTGIPKVFELAPTGLSDRGDLCR
ncbi:MAG: hypothetical protein IAG13_22235 [Deltaproteobacteria bacterium]|nr:hypothetical protein [Nannocystaceae bacterium]